MSSKQGCRLIIDLISFLLIVLGWSLVLSPNMAAKRVPTGDHPCTRKKNLE